MSDKLSKLKEIFMSKPVPVWGMVAVFVLGLLLGLGAFILLTNQEKESVAIIQSPVVTDGLETTKVEDLLTERPSESEITDDEAVVNEPREMYFKELKESFIALPVDGTEALEVEWQKARLLSQSETEKLFLSSVQATANTSTAQVEAILNNALAISKVWQTGVVRGGLYAGSAVYLWKQDPPIYDLGSPGASYHRLVLPKGENKPLLLTAYAVGDFWFTDLSKYLRPANDLRIKDLDSMPKTLVLDNNKQLILSDIRGPYSRVDLLWHEYPNDDYAIKLIGKTLDDRDVYARSWQGGTESEGCVYVYGPDGLAHTFSSVINEGQVNGSEDIVWQDGRFGGVYDPYMLNGCGGHDCTDIVEVNSIKADDLVEAGKTKQGEPVYVLKNPLDDEGFRLAYDAWYVPEGKPSIEQLVQSKKVPMFFWEDAFGRWVRYTDKDLQPLGECGKPVIYLYPEQSTEVSVRLPRFIEVTVSEPAYPATGWQVTAHPNGSLDYADGQTYGSLYWEGLGVGYQAPKQGFVVKDGEQAVFLKDILFKYGLNEVEAREFMDFWLPEMQGAPYYRLSFLTDEWNKAAPLYVTPAPDMSIRIFMDWQKLSAPISLEAPEIITPERKGFTLVEWGGLLY